jgi:Co/Zn/Cd efflux system component
MPDYMLSNERVALALIAILTSFMAFVESMLAVPAGSTALAADALTFVQHSVSAGFALWVAAGTITRPRWTVQLQGAVMMLLGILVCAIAVRRFYLGSVPHPLMMMVVGAIALAASLTCAGIMLRHRSAPAGFNPMWRLSSTDAVGNIAVIAAGAVVALTRSNIPDLVIGGAMAALYVITGWRIASSGRLDAGRTS